MTESPQVVVSAVLLVGLLVVGAELIRALLGPLRLPAMAGHILLGAGLGAADGHLFVLSEFGRHALELLAAFGVVVLLFRVGLESNLPKLVRQLPRAGFALAGSVVPSGVLGGLAVASVLGAGLIPALFAGVALTATSVGVALAPWREAGALDSDDGALLLDLAELDDLAGVLLMALLLALVPALRRGEDGLLGPLAGATTGVVLRLAVFVAFCLLFARYVEGPLTRGIRRAAGDTDVIVVVAGMCLVIAALAGWLGFSLAIGAAFAGFAFSRDPRRQSIDRAFGALFRLFTPFFFIGIGVTLETEAIGTAAGIGGLLLAVGITGKLLGTGLVVARTSGWTGGLLIGASMTPRAEIALVIMQQGRRLGEAAVPGALYTGMVFTCLASSVLAALAVPALLRRYPRPTGVSR